MAFCITVKHPTGRGVQTRVVVGSQVNAQKVVNYCINEGYAVLVQDLLGNMPTQRTNKERLREEVILINAGIRLADEFN